ncbi:MAG TPA: hypothetical protein GX016_10240 [Firmicutes bacterium]|nr:hypothetical protein [Bacillota bacterium]
MTIRGFAVSVFCEMPHAAQTYMAVAQPSWDERRLQRAKYNTIAQLI